MQPCCVLSSITGPLTEVNLPIDSLTKKIKGFAFITFMMPEHAVKAFTELDGTTFQVANLYISHNIAPKLISHSLWLRGAWKLNGDLIALNLNSL